VSKEEQPVGRIEFRDPHFDPKDRTYPSAQENYRLSAELAKIKALNTKLVEALKRVPFVKQGKGKLCPWCGVYRLRRIDHSSDCIREAALAAAEEENMA